MEPRFRYAQICSVKNISPAANSLLVETYPPFGGTPCSGDVQQEPFQRHLAARLNGPYAESVNPPAFLVLGLRENPMRFFKIAVAAAVIMAALPAFASVVMLDFEGIAQRPQGDWWTTAPVGDFYNGGGGTNYGVSFGTGAQAWNRGTWTGLWSNESSPDSILVFGGSANPNDAFLNYSAGFTAGFSFFYTSTGTSAVTVYGGLNGTGDVLATMNLSSQFTTGCTPAGTYCNWTNGGMSFEGTALSVRFDLNGNNGGTQGFDNVTFGSAVALESPSVAAVPEPETYALMLAGLAVVGVAARRRKGLAVQS